ncbi:MAG: DUF389 domain-containing protein [Synechococcaceae cyanobacterium]|nr:DUF389 domain-containing protein [Synechococcaceae cyanobacterium]
MPDLVPPGPLPDAHATDQEDLEQRRQALQHEFQGDASFSLVFVVLTLGAALIATLGLLANSPAVVIGAMVVAPWILPLQAMAFEVLRGSLASFGRALRTLLLGVLLGVSVSWSVGMLVGMASFGEEVAARTQPNLLDLGVALAAGGVAMFAKLRKEAISALAGLAIAVALVPPMCVVGLSLSAGQWREAGGALLLFLTNLLGILSGAMVALALLERPLRGRLLQSRLGLTSLALTALLVVPLGGSFFSLLARSRHQAAERRITELVQQSLSNETITLGRDSKLEDVRIRWDQDPPLIVARATVNAPNLPSPTQVAAVQAFINRRLEPRRFRLVVQRTAIEVVGPEPAAVSSPPPR